MYLIECKKDLKPHWIEEFKTRVNDETADVTVLFDGKEDFGAYSISNLRSIFESDWLASVVGDNRKLGINFVANEVCLSFCGDDFLWWTKTLRGKKFARLDELFGIVPARQENYVEHDETLRNEKARASLAKTQRKADDSTYRIACGIKRDNTVVDIEKFEGTQKQMRDFVNKLFSRNYVRTFGKGVTVYCVNWQYDADLDDLDNWKTLNQLTEEGVFTK